MNTLLAALHYLALGIGFTGVILRGMEFKRLGRSAAEGDLKRLFLADNLWGVGAVLWIATGLTRAFAGFEKGTDYYLSSHWFWLKMVLFGGMFLLEAWPMITLIRWRMAKKTSVSQNDRAMLSRFFSINLAQIHFLVAIIFVASAMSRGGFHF